MGEQWNKWAMGWVNGEGGREGGGNEKMRQ